jgi:hypothetical protein
MVVMVVNICRLKRRGLCPARTSDLLSHTTHDASTTIPHSSLDSSLSPLSSSSSSSSSSVARRRRRHRSSCRVLCLSVCPSVCLSVRCLAVQRPAAQPLRTHTRALLSQLCGSRPHPRTPSTTFDPPSFLPSSFRPTSADAPRVLLTPSSITHNTALVVALSPHCLSTSTPAVNPSGHTPTCPQRQTPTKPPVNKPSFSQHLNSQYPALLIITHPNVSSPPHSSTPILSHTVPRCHYVLLSTTQQSRTLRSSARTVPAGVLKLVMRYPTSPSVRKCTPSSEPPPSHRPLTSALSSPPSPSTMFGSPSPAKIVSAAPEEYPPPSYKQMSASVQFQRLGGPRSETRV